MSVGDLMKEPARHTSRRTGRSVYGETLGRVYIIKAAHDSILILIVAFAILLLSGCEEPAEVKLDNDEHYVLLEVRRHTAFTALNDTSFGFDMDFGGYQFLEDEEVLKVYQLYEIFNNDDEFLMIVAIDRSVSGGFGGAIGGVWPIFTSPDTINIILLPLPGDAEELIITNIHENGSVDFVFSGIEMSLKANKDWVYTESKDVVADFGYFHVSDSITFVNRALLDKVKIEFP